MTSHARIALRAASVALLDLAGRAATHIAAIADSLLLPAGVEERVARLREKASPSRGGD